MKYVFDYVILNLSHENKKIWKKGLLTERNFRLAVEHLLLIHVALLYRKEKFIWKGKGECIIEMIVD